MSLIVWIKAARLRTLPLAIAGIITGNLLAFAETTTFNRTTFILSALTAVFLQILSNYANDFGDFKNGADTSERNDRMMASGLISEYRMKLAIIILIILTLSIGITLLLQSIGSINYSFLMMLLLGIIGIFAAYYYTAGKNPYGYFGLGDISVFIFFGFISVVGSYFLQTGTIHSHIWWVAASIGMLSVGVLNVNNIRDIDSDYIKNKITIPVRLGYRKGIIYHFLLLICAFILFTTYVYFEYTHPLQLSYLILIPLYIRHFKDFTKAKKLGRQAYNIQLKFLSLLTLITGIIFCTSQLIII